MSIHIDTSKKLFQIDTANMTYAFAAAPDGRLCHLYWGGRLQGVNDLDELNTDLLAEPACSGVAQTIGWRQEYAVSEAFDELAHALFPVFTDGSRGVRLRYSGYEVQENLLSITLKDPLHPELIVQLKYRTWNQLDLISRSISVSTSGTDDIILERAYSASAELPCGQYRITHLSGHWGAEYTKYQRMLGQEMVVLESRNGHCASHQHIPFLALDLEGSAIEEHGEVFFGVLQWSG